MLNEINGYKTKPEWFIGKGSFGTVYKAEKNGAFYAIKIFQSELLRTEYRTRLDREIKAIQKIQHPNVVKLYEYGVFKEREFEYFYIVMDYIEGRPLTDFVGSLSEPQCIQVIESILDTLESIHNNGVIHRDLKPENIMINNQGVPIVLDFGLAKLIDYSSITQTGDRVGTYYYMSPEQVTDSKNIDNRSDYFAIGVIFYQLMTGVLPYDATNLPALIDQIKNQYPKNPCEINASITNKIENVILKMLEKEPYKRFQNVTEIKTAILSKLEAENKKLDLSMRYFIRLLHTEKTVFENALKEGLVSSVIFPANFFNFYHKTVDVLKSSGIPFTTDPATNRLTYTAFSKTAGVKELPYSSGDEVNPIKKKDFHSIIQVQDYVRKVLEYQIQNGVTELAAPFFFAKNTSDEFFNINLKLLKESIEYRNQNHGELPIWAGICMNVDDWHDDDEKNKILNNYVKVGPDGYFVYGDPIHNKSNLVQLYHYSDLLKKLQDSSLVPVVACRVNGFGLILLGLGISGISSGIGSLDNFKESILSDTTEGYAPDPRYYIPELLSMVTLKKRITTKLIDIHRSTIGSNLRCSCSHCNAIDTGVLSLQDMKLHFLKRRKDEIEEINAINQNDRLKFIYERINTAIHYTKTLSREGIELGDFSHLNIWKNLVEHFLKQI